MLRKVSDCKRCKAVEHVMNCSQREREGEGEELGCLCRSNSNDQRSCKSCSWVNPENIIELLSSYKGKSFCFNCLTMKMKVLRSFESSGSFLSICPA